jgi:D-alanyl-lipoteichoic acid acyltransferase DltB (MBOAT superfamily)
MHEFALEMALGWAAGAVLWRLRRGDAHRQAATWSLVVVSALVIGCWDGRALLVTSSLAVLTWGVIQAAGRPGTGPGDRSAILALGVSVLAGTLVAARWMPASPLAVTGLSFTVFRLIGVAMDGVNLGLAAPLERVLLVALFFPTFRAGPITTLQSLRETSDAHPDRAAAFRRIVLGVCRKLLLADTLSALFVQPWLERDPALLRPEVALALPVVLGLWIYWDFAGYSDIAIGVAALLGYRVPENFDRPYLSRNLLEFWRRWHITLSEWIRTRLFMKMAGRRAGPLRTHAAIVGSMALCGLWHGAGVNFLAWGLWHGIGMVAVHATRARSQGAAGERTPAAAARAEALSALGTFAYVSVGWLVFFLPLDRALAVAGRAAEALTHPAGLALVAAFAAIYTVVRELSRSGWNGAAVWSGTPIPVRGLVYALVTLGAVVQMADPATFIYFRF